LASSRDCFFISDIAENEKQFIIIHYKFFDTFSSVGDAVLWKLIKMSLAIGDNRAMRYNPKRVDRSLCEP